MANKAIMRCTKLKSIGNVAGSLSHTYRTRDTPNADENRAGLNRYGNENSRAALAKFQEMLPEKRRKNAVLGIEYVMTASPEWWEKASKREQEQFFMASRGWLEGKYGADNVADFTVHMDEKTPHISAIVVPIDPEKKTLNARRFIGSRSLLREDQTNFARAVEDLGLVRGVIGSKAHHTTVKDYYSRLERLKTPDITVKSDELKPKVLEKKLFTTKEETTEAVAKRVTNRLRHEIAPVYSMAVRSQENARDAKNYGQAYRSQEAEIKPVREALEYVDAAKKQEFWQVALAAAERLKQQALEKARGRKQERSKNRQKDTPDKGISR